MKEKGRFISGISLLLILTVLFLTACGGQSSEEPQKKQEPRLKVTTGGQELKVIHYGDRYNETREELDKRLKQAMEGKSVDEIPYIALDDEIVITAENFQTEEFSVTDYILREDGAIRYDERVAQTTVLSVTDGAAAFDLSSNPASMLSSFSGDYEPGKSIRGFVVRADIDGAPFAFAFILRTDPGIILEQDPQENEE